MDFPRWLHHKEHGAVLCPTWDYAVRYAGDEKGWHLTTALDSPVVPDETARVDPPKNKGGRPRKEAA